LAQLSNHPQALILIDARPLIVIDALQRRAKSPLENAPVAEEVRPTAVEKKALAIIKAEPMVKDVLFQPGQAAEWMVRVLRGAGSHRLRAIHLSLIGGWRRITT
jgi:hypothetical protein